ncbi:hypothetical protein [Sulfuricurvum sp.]|uniref:hypothetical protein n=1 Tax=Sulfuricurvum sp. TaxID=2025608 RepID=UPI0026284495|nr:hypothetical protein [Sulfuricurvum sp.]MDD2267466.1 hypothetical protein [Sulfuricurvum sp.]MDD2782813.1 hypothetical protein [Sulfuricurvum sp.]
MFAESGDLSSRPSSLGPIIEAENIVILKAEEVRLSAESAAQSALSAEQKSNSILTLIAQAHTQPSGTDTVAFYDPNTGVLDLGIPEGAAGGSGYTPVKGVDYFDGVNGLNGTNGTNGIDGKTAYELAVINGFIGSEVQWLSSLQGDPGIQGNQGVQGIAGYTPVKGIDYFDGINGTNGADGTSITSVTALKIGKDTSVTVDGTFVGAPYVFHILDGNDGIGSGDMLISVYDTNSDGKVNSADSADVVPWSGVTGKPIDYPPSVHNHDGVYEPVITVGTTLQYWSGDKTWQTLPTTLPASDVYAWAKAITKPSYTYFEISDIPILSNVALSGSYNDLTDKPILNIYTPVIAKMTATQASTILTLTDITELAINMEANGVYTIDAFIIYQSVSGTTGANIGISTPVGCTNNVKIEVTVATNLSSPIYSIIFPYSSVALNLGNVLGNATTTPNVNNTARVSGVIVNGPNAGSCSLQFATEVSSSAITLQVGSILVLTRVA